MSLEDVAQQTVQISRRGTYETDDGAMVDIGAAVAHAIAGSKLYRPGDFDALTLGTVNRSTSAAQIEITRETTGEAGRRLVEGEGERNVVALNFASARSAGGGFLNGAKAQEEDLARCSALYPCLLAHREFYDENRAQASVLYTDHLVYSPDVPFFRDERLALLPAPYLLSLITSPAPNAGQADLGGRSEGHLVASVLARRAEHVLAVMATHSHRVIILGAWGCGVFRNDPGGVAETFAQLLEAPRFAGVFDRVVFPIYDRSEPSTTRAAFENAFNR